MALGPANRVAVINTQTYEVEKYVLVGQRVWQLAFTPDQKTIICTNGVSNDITFIDVATDEPVQSVTVGALPWGVVVSPELNRPVIRKTAKGGNHEEISGSRFRRAGRAWRWRSRQVWAQDSDDDDDASGSEPTPPTARRRPAPARTCRN